MGRQDYETETLVAHAFDARQSDVLQYGDRTGPLDTDGHSVAVAFSCKDHGADAASDIAPTLRAMGHASSHANGGGQMAVAMPMQVRRLTPVECERLQGFPDDYTAIPWRGRPASECPDGPRYKSLGNSMAVPVMRWIGERIAAVDQAG
jgi:site-specific DNA-cytosine methylase